jgi:hypothetical protein
MNLTSSEIEQDIYDLLKDSNLESAISGKIYKSGMRPFNSELEDIVVTFISGLSNQIQIGIVNVNTYIPDIILDGNSLKNTARIKVLETEIKTWLSGIVSSKYKLELDRTIQAFPEPDIKQHFINARLSFKLLIQ